ncbi:hypothetical protein BDZ91DRAFT_728847 [Kalaharituber pfeilii]|nr:hypothetical protein BDZ91DRAFT_728847 [Kalaharituber pfeilii]
MLMSMGKSCTMRPNEFPPPAFFRASLSSYVPLLLFLCQFLTASTLPLNVFPPPFFCFWLFSSARTYTLLTASSLFLLLFLFLQLTIPFRDYGFCLRLTIVRFPDIVRMCAGRGESV